MGKEGEKLEREIEGESVGGGGGGPAMDTPERSRITTAVSKFEDSPVFNYINSLSPIKTVKSLRISQSFNSYSFAALPSIFTSPHVSSLKESRFLRRHQSFDPSKPEFSSEYGNKVGSNGRVTDVAHNADEQQEIFDPGSCIGEGSVEVSRTLNYNCGSPELSTTKCLSKLAVTSGSVVPFVQEVSETGFVVGGVHLEGIRNTEQNKEGGCDWESLMSDAADLLVFDSPDDAHVFKGPFQKPRDPGKTTCSSLLSDFSHDESNVFQKTEAVGAGGLERHRSENPSSQVVGEGHLKEVEATGDSVAGISLNKCGAGEPSDQMDNEPVSNLHRGIRRRCLVFELMGVRRKHVDDSSSSVSSIISQSDHIESNDNQLIPIKPGTDSSHCILPGIGLHLNALARASKKFSAVGHETSAPGSQLINDPSSTACFHSLNAGQESINTPLAVISLEGNKGPAECGLQGTEEALQGPGYVVGEEFNQSSPKRKRRRPENAGEIEGCKRCNCKKSKCLKLYCECFAAGVYCVEPCSCQDCFNQPIHEDTVLATRKQIESRNPLAFAPKVIRNSDSVPEIGDESSNTPASARHKRGCNCKKSGCLKKYCECYQGGVGCSINCRCEGCKNAFGRKDGSILVGVEAELEEEETEVHEKCAKDKISRKILIQNHGEPTPDSTLPATPLVCGRENVQLPFSSKNKPPRSSLLSIGSSSGFYGSQRFGKSNFMPPQAKFEKVILGGQEDEVPEILQGNGSPASCIKSASPNSKRVSPPHGDFGMSPGRRSSRKLILQSIPSFPCLTPKD